MKINHVFINQAEVIKGRVEIMAVEGCIRNYFEYLDVTGDDGLEEEYVIRLKDRAKAFVKKLVLNIYKDKTIEEVKEILFNTLWDWFYGYNEKPWDEVADDITYHYSDKDLYEVIKKEMLDTLDELLEEKSQSEKQRIAKDIESQIRHKQNTYDDMDNNKARLSKEITEPKEKLKAYQD